MSDVVYLLGAGFNHSLFDDFWRRPPPLARTFFQVLIQAGLHHKLDVIRSRLYVDLLFVEIRRYWHLTLDDLATEPFDIEDCLTLFQSQSLDHPLPERQPELDRASYALRNLLLMYLSEMLPFPAAPTASQFGAEALRQSADVLTFNYDTVAEEAIASSSGIGPKPSPDALRGPEPALDVPDEDLDASHLAWKRASRMALRSMRSPCRLPACRYTSQEIATTRIRGTASTTRREC